MAWQNFDVYEDIVGRPFGELNGDLANLSVERRLNEILVPSLLVQGACDRVVPRGHLDWLAEQLPRSRKLIVSGSGHSPFVDAPQLFARAVAEFLSEPGGPR